MDFTRGDRSLKFNVYTGTVVSSSKWSETHVHSSGGGGYLHQGSGHVSAPTVTSTVKAKHEFWIQTKEGQQIPVQLTDADFPLMANQVITLVSAPSIRKPDGDRWIFVRNHSSQQDWILNAPTNVAAAELHPMRMWSVAAPFVGVFLGAVVSPIFFIAGVGYLGYRLFKRYQDQNAIRAALVQHVEKITPNVTFEANAA